MVWGNGAPGSMSPASQFCPGPGLQFITVPKSFHATPWLSSGSWHQKGKVGNHLPELECCKWMAHENREQREEKVKGRVWGHWYGQERKKEVENRLREQTEPEKKMLYHSNWGTCLKRGSGQLCQYRETVSQYVCGSENTHVRTLRGIIRIQIPRPQPHLV